MSALLTARSATFDLPPNWDRQQLLASVPSGLISATFRLLVLVSVLIGKEDYDRMTATLWNSLDDSDKGVTGSVSYILVTAKRLKTE